VGSVAQSSIQNLNFDFMIENEYKKEEGVLSSHLATAESVCGTQQLHAFMLVKKGISNTKNYSESRNYTENYVIGVLKDITGFVTCMMISCGWNEYCLSVRN
jgi:hypothetical protein